MKKMFTMSEKLAKEVEALAKEQSASQSQIVSEALVTYITLYKIGRDAADLIKDFPTTKKTEKQIKN